METVAIETTVHHPLVTDIAMLARAVTDTPMSAVCLCDGENVWHAALSGLHAEHTPFELADDTIVRSDTFVLGPSRDPNAILEVSSMRALDVASAASVPIASPNGDVVGCLFVLDTRARAFSDAQIESLTALTRQIERHVDRATEQHHLRDLSVRLVESETALTKTLDRLELSNRDLEHFAFHAAHELQAPLLAVAAFASLIEDALANGVDGGVLETAARHVQNESERLGDQVASLLELAKFSNTGPKTERIPIAALIVDVVDSYEETIENIEIDCASGIFALGDVVALRTVLSNLLSNAHRYRSPDEPLVVHLTAVKVDNVVTIDVSDNGIGIASEEQQRIFEAFQQIGSSGSGAGLGLAMCRRIVEQLGGSITVQSELGTGSTFTLTVPSS